MLTLKRKKGDYLVLKAGQHVIYVYNQGRGKIGIKAPPEVEVWRSELLNVQEDEDGTVRERQ